MVPGQRAIALQLLASVFENVLCNLQQSKVGYDMRNASNIGKSVDWQAVWASALGPEPDLALSLRNWLLYQKEIYTSPVFRSRPKIDVGFLHGGFWKYNTKPSSILQLGDETFDVQNEGERTIQDDIVVAGQDIAAGLVRMGILPKICYLLEVLAQSDKKNCIHFIEKGIFQDMMWHLYKSPVPLDQWIKSGREYCKLMSALMIEQLRLWRVCIKYGYCIAYFTDFFASLCMWLSPPTFDELIENHVLGDFASVTREAYIVLEALATRLPNLHLEEQLTLESADRNMENWSWRLGAMSVRWLT